MTPTFSRQAVDAAYGWNRSQDWPAALALMKKAAQAGEPGADEQLALISQMPLPDLLRPPSPQRLHAKSRIAAVEGFAPPGFADWIIRASKDRLQPATMNDVHGQGRRTATTCGFGPKERDLVTGVLQQRAAILLSVPIACHEPPTAIHYGPGQEFAQHADFIEPSIPEYQAELELLGQRVGTFVTYLSDDFDGAATEFPLLNIKFRGKPGDAIFWANVLPDGSPDYLTMHQAPPPTRGEKWVFSQWIRTKRFPYEKLPGA